MLKLLMLARKRPDLTEDEFTTYWLQVHGPLVAKVPGVRRYVANVVTRDAAMSTADCDGIAEVWFDNMAALQDAAESAAGKACLDDLSRFCAAGSGTAVVEEVELDLG